MQFLRYPFYFRCHADAESAKNIVKKLGHLVQNSQMQTYSYRFRQVDLKLGSSNLWKRNRNIVPKEADTRKWIGVISIPLVAYKKIGEPDIAAMLRNENLELVEKQETPEAKFEAGASVSVNITSKDKMRKLASALDKKIGQGRWRMRGHHGYKRQLTALLQKDKNKTSLRMVFRGAGITETKSVPVTIHVNKDAQITQSELEKLIFTINLKL